MPPYQYARLSLDLLWINILQVFVIVRMKLHMSEQFVFIKRFHYIARYTRIEHLLDNVPVHIRRNKKGLRMSGKRRISHKPEPIMFRHPVINEYEIVEV